MNLPTALKTPVGKLIAALLGLTVVAALIYGTVNYFRSDFAEREQERQTERAAFAAEKAPLVAERDQLRGRVQELEAMNQALATVAESKRADRATTVKELEQIENEHIQKKAEAEASGSALSDTELQRALCLSLAKRGYKVTCTN